MKKFTRVFSVISYGKIQTKFWTIKHACTLGCSVMSDSLQPMDCSPPCSFFTESKVLILEWVAIASSKGSSRNRNQTHISCGSCIGRWILYHGDNSESESEVAQSCPTLCDPMDCTLPGSSVPGIFQARVLEWGAISFKNLLRKETKEP